MFLRQGRAPPRFSSLRMLDFGKQLASPREHQHLSGGELGKANTFLTRPGIAAWASLTQYQVLLLSLLNFPLAIACLKRWDTLRAFKPAEISNGATFSKQANRRPLTIGNNSSALRSFA